MAKPEGVRLVRADGTEVPIELLHEGIDDRGVDVWRIPVSVCLRDGDRVMIAMLPGNTSLVGGHIE